MNYIHKHALLELFHSFINIIHSFCFEIPTHLSIQSIYTHKCNQDNETNSGFDAPYQNLAPLI